MFPTNENKGLPKARLCAKVVLAIALEATTAELAEAVSLLKSGVGPNWSTTTALQFMSGRQAEIIVKHAPPDEQAGLHLAHLIAEATCNVQCLAEVGKLTPEEIAKLRAATMAKFKNGPAAKLSVER